MADPVTWAIVGSTALTAVGAIAQGNAAAGAANTNAGVLDQNAGIELAQAGQREEAKRRETRLILGKQRAAVAQAGGGMGGSAADVMQQSSANAEMDALTLRYEGELRARGLRQEAAAERYAGKVAKRQSRFEAVSSVLSGAGSYMGHKADVDYRKQSLARMS